MPGSWDVTPHNNNKNLSVPFPPQRAPIRPSRSLGSPEIPRDYDRGSVFTNHSDRFETSPSAPPTPYTDIPPRLSASFLPSFLPSKRERKREERGLRSLPRCRELFHLRCAPAQLANKLRPVASFRLSEDT